MALVVDVETAGGFSSPLVYDLGLAVVERLSGRIVESHSLIIREVFFDRKDEMCSAYYANKVPAYFDGIKRGEHRVVRFWTAWRIVRDLMAKYGITRVYAYNCKFDRDALNNTAKIITSGKMHNFFPKGSQFCDIWHMACQTVLSQKAYRKFAIANGFVSDAGNIRTSAECAYAYMVNDANFEESHTGLADVEIEIAILHRVLRQKKRTSEAIVHNPWQIPQRVA